MPERTADPLLCRFAASDRMPSLARISHQRSTAARDGCASTALRSVVVLDVLFKYACAPLPSHALYLRTPHAPRDDRGEKYGLASAHGSHGKKMAEDSESRINKTTFVIFVERCKQVGNGDRALVSRALHEGLRGTPRDA